MKNLIKKGVVFVFFLTIFTTAYGAPNDEIKTTNPKIEREQKNRKIKKETPNSAKEWHNKEKKRRENKKRAEEMRQKQQEKSDSTKIK
ncbi:MAG: hypothetical protein N2202_04170 [Proteobacteria bacterium]|nr:hypothetical protein [Pseudomonadota bacterium]